MKTIMPTQEELLEFYDAVSEARNHEFKDIEAQCEPSIIFSLTNSELLSFKRNYKALQSLRNESYKDVYRRARKALGQDYSIDLVKPENLEKECEASIYYLELLELILNNSKYN